MAGCHHHLQTSPEFRRGCEFTWLTAKCKVHAQQEITNFTLVTEQPTDRGHTTGNGSITVTHHITPHHITPHHTKPHHTTPHQTTHHINGTYDGTSTAYCLYWVRPLHLHSIMVCKHHCGYTCTYVRTTPPRVCQVKQAFALTSILARSSLADFSSLHFWIFFLMSCRARQWHLHTHTGNPQPPLTHTWHLHTHAGNPQPPLTHTWHLHTHTGNPQPTLAHTCTAQL